MGRDDWLSCFDLGGDGDEPDFLMCTDSQISLAKRSARCAGDRGGIESDSDAVSERPSITVRCHTLIGAPKIGDHNHSHTSRWDALVDDCSMRPPSGPRALRAWWLFLGRSGVLCWYACVVRGGRAG